MTPPIQPGLKQDSPTGRLAVNFRASALRARLLQSGRVDRRPAAPQLAFSMIRHTPIRFCFGAACALLLAVLPAMSQTRLAPVPNSREPRPAPRMPQRPQQQQREEHLERWMQSHSGMSLVQQQHALQNEPGFRELPPQVQQNRLNTLARLYNMNPQQRTRILDRAEALERLAPAQRQQWRDAVQSLNTMPPQRKRMLAGTIVELRELPPEQRQAALNSPAYRAQFSPYERQTLGTLLMAEPYPAVRNAPRMPYPEP